jgi:hypothetical protein
MAFYGLAVKAASTVFTGAVGVAAYELSRKAVSKAPLHEASVVAAAWGLRSTRKAEEGAEHARLKVADVVAEARERLGEQAQPPAGHDTSDGHTH